MLASCCWGDWRCAVTCSAPLTDFPPVFHIKLRDHVLLEGDPVTLSCLPAGSPHPHVTWRKGGLGTRTDGPSDSGPEIFIFMLLLIFVLFVGVTVVSA